MPYVYQAEFLCDHCVPTVPKPSGPEPYDTDEYPMYVLNAGECDCPQCCGMCGAPIDCTLTTDGVDYVLSAIQESLESAVTHGRGPVWDRIRPMRGTAEETHTFWHGSREVDVLRAWARDVREYGLEPGEKAIVDLFLSLSKTP